MDKPLIIWGGLDINPRMYKNKRSFYAGRYSNFEDEVDSKKILENLFLNKPVIGICRGAQMLCVLAEGTLYQHSLGHTNNLDNLKTWDGHEHKALSDHHQIMRPKGRHEVLAYSNRTTRVWEEFDVEKDVENVPEIIWYPEQRWLAIQPHPEWEEKDSAFLKWVNALILDLEIDYKF